MIDPTLDDIGQWVAWTAPPGRGGQHTGYGVIERLDERFVYVSFGGEALPMTRGELGWKDGMERHAYEPDTMTMGDCRLCGHVRDVRWHRQGMWNSTLACTTS